jgi:hypothetical protein
MLAAIKQNKYTINWVVYSEALFPSLYNEFYSSSIQRVAFDNGYWRDYSAERIEKGATFTNSFNVKYYNISQSSWPLDPTDDFLTRTKAPGPTIMDPSTDTAAVVGDLKLYPENMRLTGAAGELQNNYFFVNPYYKTGSGNPLLMGRRDRIMIRALSPGALYARKHMLPNPRSVAALRG